MRRSSRRIAWASSGIFARESSRFLEPGCDRCVRFRAPLDGKLFGLPHDERQLFIRRLSVGRHKIAVFHDLAAAVCSPSTTKRVSNFTRTPSGSAFGT